MRRARDERVDLLLERQENDARILAKQREQGVTEPLHAGIVAVRAELFREVVVDVEPPRDRCGRQARSPGRAIASPKRLPGSVCHSSRTRPASPSITATDSRMNL